MTAGEVVRGIETNGKWMVLKRVHTDPAYQALADWILDEVHSRGRAARAARSVASATSSSPRPTRASPPTSTPSTTCCSRSRAPRTPRSAPSLTSRPSAPKPSATTAAATATSPAAGERGHLSDGAGGRRPHPGARSAHGQERPHLLDLPLTPFYTRERRAIVDTYALNARLRRLHLTPAPGEHPSRDRVKAGRGATCAAAATPFAGSSRAPARGQAR